jgi:hypothetical protein
MRIKQLCEGEYMKTKLILGAAIATCLGFSDHSISLAQMQSTPSAPWYNCLTREVWSPQKQDWCSKVNQLQNAAYTLPELGTLQLSRGRYENQQTQVTVHLMNQTGMVQFGDLNGDGREDALTVLTVRKGSDVLTYLVAALNQNDRLQPTAPLFLGDGVQIKSMVIESGQVKANLLTPAPEDPICCPTQNVTRTYRLNYQLVQEAEAVANPPEGDRLQYREIDLSQFEPSMLSGQTPRAIALAVFGTRETPEGNFEQTVSDKEEGLNAHVLITQIGLLDDSVRGVRYWIEFVQVSDTPRRWQIVWAGRQQLCQPGRGSQDWTIENCE